VSPVTVHREVVGPDDAPVVVLSGSLGSTGAMWDPQVGPLAERFRVVRYDTRGHGRSPVPPGPYDLDDLADDVVAVLDELGVDRVHFVGLSLGGMTGLRLAARRPERVDRMVLLCTGAHLPPASSWTERAATVRAQGTAAVAPTVVQRWFTPAHLASRPDVRARAEEMIATAPSEGYAACCEVIARMDLRPDLPAVTAPTLAIAGADDPATPPSCLEEIVAGVPDGRLLVVPDAAHMANLQQPDTVTAAILGHLTDDTNARIPA
jgi:3-oxoadipate enol-lactonase